MFGFYHTSPIFTIDLRSDIRFSTVSQIIGLLGLKATGQVLFRPFMCGPNPKHFDPFVEYVIIPPLWKTIRESVMPETHFGPFASLPIPSDFAPFLTSYNWAPKQNWKVCWIRQKKAPSCFECQLWFAVMVVHSGWASQQTWVTVNREGERHRWSRHMEEELSTSPKQIPHDV